MNRKAIAIITTLFFFLYFSPHTANAEESGTNSVSIEEVPAVVEAESELSTEKPVLEESAEEVTEPVKAPVVEELDQAESVEEIAPEPSVEESAEVKIQTSALSEELVLEKGVIDPLVLEMKLNLEKLGFVVSSNPTEYFGSVTASTVSDFQTYYGMEATGKAGTATLAKIDVVLNSVLREGQRHPDAVKLKEDLAVLGYVVSSNPTEHYGPITADTVGEFQKTHNLRVNEIADEVTLRTVADEVLKKQNELTVSNLVSSSLALFEKGTLHQQVIKLKEDLARLGFGVSSNPTEYYGSLTAAAVSDFQTYFGLDATGKTDAGTLEKIETVLTESLQDGQIHPDVIKLKENLAILGYVLSSNPTEFYGPVTAETVGKFQEENGLRVTGIADEVTLKTISDEVANKRKEVSASNLATVLKIGSYDSKVLELKENLDILGFGVSSNPTKYYGSVTASVVKDFQTYYGMEATGIADAATQTKINAILSTHLRLGQSHPDAIKLKEDLAKLGFIASSNPTEYYGPQTAGTVSDFQKNSGLRVNGIADEVTLSKLKELVPPTLKTGVQHATVIELKNKLAELGFVVSPNPTGYYGAQTAGVVSDFQGYYGLKVTGIADVATLAKIEDVLENSLRLGQTHSDVINLKVDLAKLGFIASSNPNGYYGLITAETVSKFQKANGLRVTGVADELTLNKLEGLVPPTLKSGVYHPVIITLKDKLAKLGFVISSTPTAYYGGQTADMVSEFQAYYKLPITGIASVETLAKIEEVLNNPLRLGQYHPEVIKLKNNLEKFDLAVSSTPNDYYGQKTASAVSEFQKRFGLRVSGIADEVTLAKIATEIPKIAVVKPVKIFLDPGHGGSDPGGSGYGLLEKNIVLEIALKTADVLRNQYIGADVRMSRTTDVYPSLTDRANMANEWNADYFVSFHTNACCGAYGFETFRYNGYVTTETIKRQLDIHSYLINKMGVYNRGVKEADYSVLRNTNMPSILLEYLFIDNYQDNLKLQSYSYRQWLGQITAEAIANSYGLKRR